MEDSMEGFLGEEKDEMVLHGRKKRSPAPLAGISKHDHLLLQFSAVCP